MEQKILLEKNRSKYSVNRDSYINLDLSNKSRLLPFNDLTDKLNLNQLYLDERNDCNKYRMIFTVNTICSNVLFNSRTEVVRYEGSDKCDVLLGNIIGDKGNAENTTSLKLMQAIRDTEYSHPDLFDDKTPYVYHCGTDIFNNHMLRNNDFIYVNKIGHLDKTDSQEVFNTIEDFVRTSDGRIVKEDVAPGEPKTSSNNGRIHLYQYDTILTMYDAFTSRLKLKDGWYGFNNSTNISIPNACNGKVSINKILNNNKACEFIDMYPDRSLYSFIPKMNKYRRRIEKNWDYCITYPFKKEKDLLNKISFEKAFSGKTITNLPNNLTEKNGGCAIRIIEAKRIYSSSGNNLIRFKSLFKHNFKIGDYIKLYYQDNDELLYFNKRIRIIGLGDYQGNDENRYFVINYNDLNNKFKIADETVVGSEYFEQIIDENGKPVNFYYKKDVDGVECEYYFRRFTRITKNNDGITNLTSDVNKFAYGENIYGDRIGQVVFTDDIDVEGLVDHRGKPLTEVYFTIMKRNAGWQKWYNEERYRDSSIEFSHCFGKVTTGIELPIEEKDYNIRKLHNIDFGHFPGVTPSDIFSSGLTSGIPKTIDNYENGITYEESYFSGSSVIGDLVEFNPITCVETVLEIVEHRFNTAQRETTNNKYFNITYDEMTSDDYDFSKISTSTGNTGYGARNGFNISHIIINKSKRINEIDETVLEASCPGNINPEGYFYNPYTKIKIKEVSEDISKVKGRVIKITNSHVDSNNTLKINTAINYKLIKNDILCIYNNETKENFWGCITDVSGTVITIYMDDATVFDSETCTIVSTTDGVPLYATYLPTSHSFVWRSIIPMSELENDSILYNMPFSNGRNYIEQNVILYLKRQDPTGEYGLLNYDEGAPYKCSLNGYRIKGWKPIDLSGKLYNKGNLGEICY